MELCDKNPRVASDAEKSIVAHEVESLECLQRMAAELEPLVDSQGCGEGQRSACAREHCGLVSLARPVRPRACFRWATDSVDGRPNAPRFKRGSGGLRIRSSSRHARQAQDEPEAS